MKKLSKKKLIIGAISIIFISHIVFLIKAYTRLKEIRKRYSKCVFFAGQQSSFKGINFEGESFAVAFAGLELDFRGATLQDKATLDLYGEYCGINIIVPKDWQVQMVGQANMGGVSNMTKTKKEIVDAPTLIIKHDIKYAGLTVSNKDMNKDKDKSKNKKKASKCSCC